MKHTELNRKQKENNMRKIYDLTQVVKSTMNRDIPLATKKKILLQYGIHFISTGHKGLRFQCHNTDPRWFGKTVLAKPTNI